MNIARHCVPWIVITLTLVLPVGSAGQTAASKPAVSSNPLRASSQAIEELVSRVGPSVVQVVATGFQPRDTGSQIRTDVALRRGRTVGSGVIVDSAGYILTNAHVVEGAEQIQVVLAGASPGAESVQVGGPDARVVEARLVGKSDELDLALLAVRVGGLSALPLADYGALRQGELVFAFGSPDALRNSVSMGVISAVAQQADSTSSMVWVQTDAAVNPGNSGGPLVNVDGELVGVNTFIRSMSGGSEGLGFAVPSAVVAVAYPQLRDFGHLHRAVLGFAAQPITPALKRGLNLPTSEGVVVADIMPGGPAANVDLRIGDVITGIGSESLGAMSLARFNVLMLTLSDGQDVSLRVLRGDQPVILTITARVPPHRCERTEPLDLRTSLIEPLGVIGAPVDQSVAEMMPGLRIPSGVVVIARVEGSQAAASPLTMGDVIHAVNETSITTPAELRQALSTVRPGDAVVLQVERNGELTYVVHEVD